MIYEAVCFSFVFLFLYGVWKDAGDLFCKDLEHFWGVLGCLDFFSRLAALRHRVTDMLVHFFALFLLFPLTSTFAFFFLSPRFFTTLHVRFILFFFFLHFIWRVFCIVINLLDAITARWSIAGGNTAHSVSLSS